MPQTNELYFRQQIQATKKNWQLNHNEHVAEYFFTSQELLV